MVSMDACTEYLLTEGEPSFLRWREALQKFRDRISGLRYYHVLCYGEDSARSHGFYAFDPSKLLVNAKRAGLTGAMAARTGSSGDYHFELEMSMGSNALAMTGPGEDEQQLLRFADALRELDREAAAPESAKHNISGNAAGDFSYHHKESAGLDRRTQCFIYCWRQPQDKRQGEGVEGTLRVHVDKLHFGSARQSKI
jgi:hypothetical protein